MHDRNEVREIDEFFDEFIYSWMFNDIASALKGNANFLAGLGLLCYTEAMGKLECGSTSKRTNINAFCSFLKRIQPSLDENQGKQIYKKVRVPMTHHYLPWFDKKLLVIARETNPPSDTAILQKCDSTIIVVDNYFANFKIACKALHNEVQNAKCHPIMKIIKARSSPDICPGNMVL